MCPTPSITEVYRGQEASLLKHLHAGGSPDEETVHKLRVDIKRIRALLYFLETTNPPEFNAGPMLKWVRPVFKQAGKIREATLILKSLPSLRSQGLRNFRNAVKKKKDRHEKEFEKTIRHFNQKKFSKHYHRLFSFLKQQPGLLKKSAAYSDSLFTEIRRLRRSAGNDETLHDIRKKLKQAKTIDGLLNLPATRFSSAKLKDLEEHIGQWHDEVILSESLTRYARIHNGHHALNAFLATVNARRERLKKRILTRLKQV